MKPKVVKKVAVKLKANSHQQTDSSVPEWNLELGDFRQIIHLSDIHIKPWQRHDEYLSVFSALDQIMSDMNTPSVVVITGDVFDKTTFRPETFKICRDFFKMLVRHCHVIVIAGQYDIPDQRRLDGISPVVEDLDRVHYLKNSGIYHCSGTRISFVASCLNDGQIIKRSQLPGIDGKYIALHYSCAPDGDTSVLQGYDAVLLGGIHHYHVLPGNMAYAGSLIQQDHNETLNHGFLVWNCDLEPEYIAVKNDWGYVNVIVKETEWEYAEPLPEYGIAYCHVRLITYCGSQPLGLPSYVDLVISELKQRHKVLSISKKIGQQDPDQDLDVQEENLDLQRKQDEISIIHQYTNNDKVLELHQSYQTQIDHDSTDHQASLVWKPMTLEFKNMFGYGGGKIRRINFKKGVTAIISGNATGKTSLVNIILFAIFGKTLLNPSGNAHTYDIINNKETSGYVKLLLKYGDKYYLIERGTSRAKTKKTAAAPANTVLQMLKNYEFSSSIWESNILGEKLVEVDAGRDWSKEMFGSIEDFSLCNLLNKESSLDLLTMTPAEQVKTLKRLFKVNIYDDYRELNRAQLAKYETDIADGCTRLKTLQASVPDCQESEDECDLLDERDQLEAKISDMRACNETNQEQLALLDSQIGDLRHNIDRLWSEPIDIDLEPGDHSAQNHAQFSLSVGELQTKIDTLKSMIGGNMETVINQENIPFYLKHLESEKERISQLIGDSAKTVVLTKTDTQQKLERRKMQIEEMLSGLPNYDVQDDVPDDVQDPAIIANEINGIITDNRGFNLSDLEPDPELEINPDLGVVLHSVPEISELESQLLYVDRNLADLENSILDDCNDNIIDNLASCPLLDDNIKEQYSLDSNTAYCIVEERIVDEITRKLSVPTEIAHSHSNAERNKKLKTIARLEVEKANIELQLKQSLENISIRNNIAVRINELKSKLEIATRRKQRHDYEKLTHELSVIESKLSLIIAKQELADITNEYQQIIDATRFSTEASMLENVLIHKKASEYQDRCQLINYLQEVEKERSRIAGEIKSNKAEIKHSTGRLQQMQRKLSIMEYKREQYTKLSREIAELEASIAKMEEIAAPMREYHDLMGNKGIIGKILFSKVQELEEYVNSILANFTRYTVVILFDEKKQTVSIITKEGDEFLSVNRLSGYEKLMMQISFKRALNKFSYNSKGSFIIIDEAMDCIDQDNFGTRLPDVISLIVQDYSVCLAISQRDIQHISDYNIRPCDI
jgi:DNA repair exonuclease SbcCD ATPase subunit